MVGDNHIIILRRKVGGGKACHKSRGPLIHPTNKWTCVYLGNIPKEGGEKAGKGNQEWIHLCGVQKECAQVAVINQITVGLFSTVYAPYHSPLDCQIFLFFGK